MWIEKRSNGKYRYCERYLDPMTGKEKRVSVTMDKKTPAARKEAAALITQLINKAQMQSMENNHSLNDIMELYLSYQVRVVKPSTYSRNKYALNSVVNILGPNVLINQLTAQYIKSKLLATGESMGRINERITRLKAMLRWAYENDFVPDISYLSKVKKFKDTEKKKKLEDKYLERSELKALLDSMEQPVWRAITECMALSGLRIGELLALTPKDVDFDNGVLHITKTYDMRNHLVSETPKTDCSVRDVAIQEELDTCLRQIHRLMLQRRIKYGLPKPSLFLFDRNGNYINYYSYNKYLRVKSQSVLSHMITTHALRHTHASLMFEAGIDIDVISRRLGHEDSKLTREIYLHITDKVKERDSDLIHNIKII